MSLPSSAPAPRARTFAFYVPVRVPAPTFTLRVEREITITASDTRISFAQPISRHGRQHSILARATSNPYPAARPASRTTFSARRTPDATATGGTPDPLTRRASAPRANSPHPAVPSPSESAGVPQATPIRSAAQVREPSPVVRSTAADVESEDSDEDSDDAVEGGGGGGGGGDSSSLSPMSNSHASSREPTPQLHRDPRGVRFEVDVVPATPDDGLIPEPSGTAGRPESGGFNLRKSMKVSKQAYSALKRETNAMVSKWLDHSKTLTKQSPAAVARAKELLVEMYPMTREKYRNQWPFDKLMSARLAYTSGRIAKGVAAPQHESYHTNVNSLRRE